MKRTIIALAAAAGALTMASAANAAPVLRYDISFNGGSPSSFGQSSGGSATFNASRNGIEVNGVGRGAPFLSVPDLSLNTFTAKSDGTGGSVTIRLSVTGMEGFTGSSLLNAFTLNSLTGGSFTSATISNYLDNSNAAFGMGTLLGTKTYTGNSSFNDQIFSSVSPSSLFSETAIITLNFVAGAAGTVSASSQISAAAAVPEPATWAMMMLGFGAMGAMVRRRKTTTTARIRFA